MRNNRIISAAALIQIYLQIQIHKRSIVVPRCSVGERTRIVWRRPLRTSDSHTSSSASQVYLKSHQYRQYASMSMKMASKNKEARSKSSKKNYNPLSMYWPICPSSKRIKSASWFLFNYSTRSIIFQWPLMETIVSLSLYLASLTN